MIGFLNSLLAFISSLMKVLEKFRIKKQIQSDYELRSKADAYERLQKAIRAKHGAGTFSSSDDIMSEDRFKRQ